MHIGQVSQCHLLGIWPYSKALGAMLRKYSYKEIRGCVSLVCHAWFSVCLPVSVCSMDSNGCFQKLHSLQNVWLFCFGSMNCFLYFQVILVSPTFGELLATISSRLGIDAKRLFNTHGAEVIDVDVIRDDDILVATEGSTYQEEKPPASGNIVVRASFSLWAVRNCPHFYFILHMYKADPFWGSFASHSVHPQRCGSSD